MESIQIAISSSMPINGILNRGNAATAKTGTGGYRFAFNGKERDDEVKGAGNSLDFGARIYDSRLGRWLSVDPLAKKFPELCPYIFSNNNVISLIDTDGNIVKYANAETQKEVEAAMAADPKFAKSVQTLMNSKVVYNYNCKGTMDLMQTDRQSVMPGDVNTKNGSQVNINFYLEKNSATDGKYTALYHETEHGLQFDRGEIGFRKNSKGKWVFDASYDITDEVKAFDAGFKAPGVNPIQKQIWDKKSLQQKINYVANRSIIYGDLKNQAESDKANGNPIEREEGGPLPTQVIVKTDKQIFRTYNGK